MYSVNNTGFKVAICNLDNGAYSQMLASSIESDVVTTFFQETDEANCITRLKDEIMRGALIGVLIPKSFSDNIINFTQPSVNIFFDNSKPNLGFFSQTYVNSKINGLDTQVLRDAEEDIKSVTGRLENDLENTINILQVINYSIPDAIRSPYNQLYIDVYGYYENISMLNRIDLEFLVKPISTRLIGVFEARNSTGFSFSVLYTVLNLFVLLLLSSVSMVYDKRNNFLTRLKTSTTPIIFYIASKALFFSLISVMIFVLSFSVFLIKDAYFNINFSLLAISVILVSMISTLLGSIIGLSSKDEASSIMVSLFVGLAFMLLSGLFYPVELLPSPISAAVSALPTSYAVRLLNYGLIFNAEVEASGSALAPVLIYLVLLLGVNYWLISRDND